MRTATLSFDHKCSEIEKAAFWMFREDRADWAATFVDAVLNGYGTTYNKGDRDWMVSHTTGDHHDFTMTISLDKLPRIDQWEDLICDIQPEPENNSTGHTVRKCKILWMDCGEKKELYYELLTKE